MAWEWGWRLAVYGRIWPSWAGDRNPCWHSPSSSRCSSSNPHPCIFSMRLMLPSISHTPKISAKCCGLISSTLSIFSLSFLFIFFFPKSCWLSFSFPYDINRFSQFLIVSLKQGMWKNANVVFKTRFVDGTSRVLRCVPGKDGDEGAENNNAVKKAASVKHQKSQRDTAGMDRTNLVAWATLK